MGRKQTPPPPLHPESGPDPPVTSASQRPEECRASRHRVVRAGGRRQRAWLPAGGGGGGRGGGGTGGGGGSARSTPSQRVHVHVYRIQGPPASLPRGGGSVGTIPASVSTCSHGSRLRRSLRPGSAVQRQPAEVFYRLRCGSLPGHSHTF